MSLSLFISPCPNDTFMFDALVNKKIKHDFDIKLKFADIEELNKSVMEGIPDVAKLSYPALFQKLDEYVLLNSGAALGRNCGPLIISKEKLKLEDLHNKTIAIPGKNTTAYLLFNTFVKGKNIIKEVIFSDIMEGVQTGKYDAGLIIHESRFTYQKLGLLKVTDLGELWEDYTKLPIPLGGIAAKRSLGYETIKRIEKAIENSIKYAYENRESSLQFIKEHAQELENEVTSAHIETYVNEYSISLGYEGQNAIKRLYQESGYKGFEDKIFI